jgi:hypothetical protein
MRHHILAERGFREGAAGENPGGVSERFGNAFQPAEIRVALESWHRLHLGIDAVQPGCDHRGECQIRVHIAARQTVLDAQGFAVAEHPERAGAVIHSPGERGRRETAGGVALVGVDVGREEKRQLLGMRQ